MQKNVYIDLLSGRYCLNTEPKEQRPGNSQAKGPLNINTLENEHNALPTVQALAKLSGSMTEGQRRKLLCLILKKVFLNNYHKDNNAKFVPFAGYSMPINYDEGIIKEHLHVRNSVGIFDVSHMGQILILIQMSKIL